MSNWDFPAMTNIRKGKDERRFATKGSTERPVGREARQAVLTAIIPYVVTH